MKNSNDTIGDRTRDLLAYSAVPQPTAPPRAPSKSQSTNIIWIDDDHDDDRGITHIMRQTNE